MSFASPIRTMHSSPRSPRRCTIRGRRRSQRVWLWRERTPGSSASPRSTASSTAMPAAAPWRRLLNNHHKCEMKGNGSMRFQQIGEGVTLGDNVIIRDFVNLYGCAIGDDSRIGTFVEIQKGVTIGKRCKIQSHTFICTGVTIEDDVFV